MTISCRSILALAAILALATTPAHAIEDGFKAEPCAWPEVVQVFSGWGTVPDLDGSETMTCTGVYLGGRTVLTAAECVNLQPTPYEIHFADVFRDPQNAAWGLHMAIPVDDCRMHPVLPVAACTLRENPTMQTIPIVAPCEVEELLVAGAELFVASAKGEKRWAFASLAADIPAVSISFELPDTIWTTQTELSSQIMQTGDLGAPLYVRAPDGSLRIAGITLGIDPGSWIGTWMLVDWLLDEESEDVVLPCHSLAGDWAPGSACEFLVADRSIGEGMWGRGPAVCETAQVVAPTPTCG